MQDFQYHITLISYGEENTSHARAWYKAAYNSLPRGAVAVIDNKDAPDQPIRMTKTSLTGCVRYSIPLTRDITPYELNEVKNKWAASGVVGNFSITSSSTVSERMKLAASNMVLTDNDYHSVAYQLMKAEHQRWYAEKAKSGWSYGPILSVFNKTHPLMRPWEDLPEEYRSVDRNTPHTLLDVLSSHGYAVVRKHELDSLVSLVHSIKIPE